MSFYQAPFRVGAVSYLNSVPLVWGMLHGPQAPLVDISFSLPSTCANQMNSGELDIGLLPVAAIARQGLVFVPGVGVTCLGAVRSILLFSRVPWTKVRTFAADSSSRTSVELAKVILRECYGVKPYVFAEAPNLETMLAHADAALVIGDPALHLNPETLPYSWLDLGQEWYRLTGLPMVFAAWAGRPGIPVEELQRITTESYEFGAANLQAIIDQQPLARGISRASADDYLRENIRFQIGPREQRGLEAFLELAHLAKPVLVSKN